MTGDATKSPFERLKQYYDTEALSCPDCGYADTDGEWETETNGRVVEYHHECPTCGTLQQHTVHLDEA
ncbi:HVO_0649 family zinc finger protein [Haloarcula onubensis]|uniref:Small CPxCG-related zinc finger protein n=1 Tax=Haloarcula onubensis TaxID=2950539 RepID=A0ABU2FT28_9EURY|nr:HVO_0649 family zinc finger protein [Halomicroarcula sp. S3CR25-11]MDS0283579.1 hypothetical protein [Halomicroarcula sp. S3CR25-11]